MSKLDRLKGELVAYQQSYQRLSDRLKELREQFDLETRNEEKLRLTRLIERTRAERDSVEEEMNALEQEIKSLSSLTSTGFNGFALPQQGAEKNLVRTILIVAANPIDTTQLRLSEEVREIQNGLAQSRQRDSLVLEQQWATRPEDLRRAMLNQRPNIVHFCGHGEGEAGICLENNVGEVRLVSTEALANFFKLFANSVECVLLNACYSEIQAEAIVQHIPYVIGMNQGIGDKAAIEFAVAFYDALGAGETVDFAFELGRNAIQMQGIPEHSTPVLKKNALKKPDPNGAG